MDIYLLFTSLLVGYFLFVLFFGQYMYNLYKTMNEYYNLYKFIKSHSDNNIIYTMKHIINDYTILQTKYEELMDNNNRNKDIIKDLKLEIAILKNNNQQINAKMEQFMNLYTSLLKKN
jgi:FtsZ-binding cell division protein ZapB